MRSLVPALFLAAATAIAAGAGVAGARLPGAVIAHAIVEGGLGAGVAAVLDAPFQGGR